MKTPQSAANYFVNGKVTFRFFWEAGSGWYALEMAVLLSWILVIAIYGVWKGTDWLRRLLFNGLNSKNQLR